MKLIMKYDTLISTKLLYSKRQHDCFDRPLCRGYIMDFVSKYSSHFLFQRIKAN